MTKIRDTQRRKLYAAENVIRGTRFETVPEIEDYIGKITRSVWWKKHHRYPLSTITVHDGRGRRNACATGMTDVKFPKWARCQEIILHELAHLVINSQFGYSGAASHGCEFAKVLLLMVKRFMGREDYLTMKARFKEYKVHYTTSRI
jgi:putative metallohydrolase (TIGR04338 family)